MVTWQRLWPVRSCIALLVAYQDDELRRLIQLRALPQLPPELYCPPLSGCTYIYPSSSLHTCDLNYCANFNLQGHIFQAALITVTVTVPEARLNLLLTYFLNLLLISMSARSTPSSNGERKPPGILRDEADTRVRNGEIPIVLPHERVFRIQIGSELFTLSGASLSSDGKQSTFCIIIIEPSFIHFCTELSVICCQRPLSLTHLEERSWLCLTSETPF